MSIKGTKNWINQRRQQSKKRKTLLRIAIGGAFLLLLGAGVTWLALNFRVRTVEPTRPELLQSQAVYEEVYEFLAPMYPTFNVSTISIEGKQVYSFFRPPTNEVTEEELVPLMQATDVALKLMEVHPTFTTNNVTLTFVRPLEHGIIIFDRSTNAPDVILSMPEFTMTPEDYMVVGEDGETRNERDRPLSVLNLSSDGTTPFGITLVANYKSIIQAVCLGYARDSYSNDPACNIYSINAAAGLAKVDKDLARETIEGYGMTSIGFLTGVDDLLYHFDEAVFDRYYNAQLPEIAP